MIRRMLYVIGIVVLLTILVPQAVYAWEPSDTPHSIYDPNYTCRFYNYDFENNNPDMDEDADFPICLIFYDDASVWKVREMYWGYASGDSDKYCKLYESYWNWDNDKGTKGDSEYNPNWDAHCRPYARNGVRMYCLAWGYYCVATAHYDYFYHMWSGKTETAEHEFALIAEDEGCEVDEDEFDCDNYEAYRVEGWFFQHIWLNSGDATLIRME
jgi:hypothetical protein